MASQIAHALVSLLSTASFVFAGGTVARKEASGWWMHRQLLARKEGDVGVTQTTVDDPRAVALPPARRYAVDVHAHGVGAVVRSEVAQQSDGDENDGTTTPVPEDGDADDADDEAVQGGTPAATKPGGALKYECSDPPLGVKYEVKYYNGTVACGNLLLESDIGGEHPWVPPKITFPSATDGFYTLMYVDPDANLPDDASWPDATAPGSKAPVRHWVVGNIEASMLKSGDLFGATTVSAFKGPSPPGGSHRYGQFLFRQTGRLNFTKLPSPDGIYNWDYKAFIEKYDLGSPVASNFHVTQHMDPREASETPENISSESSSFGISHSRGKSEDQRIIESIISALVILASNLLVLKLHMDNKTEGVAQGCGPKSMLCCICCGGYLAICMPIDEVEILGPPQQVAYNDTSSGNSGNSRLLNQER